MRDKILKLTYAHYTKSIVVRDFYQKNRFKFLKQEPD